MWKRGFILVLLLAVLPGCAVLGKFGKKKPPAETVATQNFLGTISMVNDAGRFVLVDFGGFAAPTPGAEMQVRRGGEDVATLKAGAEMRRPFAAADIVQGAPQPGDDVWSKKPTP
ncbi:MAG: hypothetical protein ABIT76_08370 [Chthoniobacterales bacterium]